LTLISLESIRLETLVNLEPSSIDSRGPTRFGDAVLSTEQSLDIVIDSFNDVLYYCEPCEHQNCESVKEDDSTKAGQAMLTFFVNSIEYMFVRNIQSIVMIVQPLCCSSSSSLDKQ
jgi:hypothetical protein